MKCVFMSDLHGYLPKADTIPVCDVVGICGDIVPLDYQNDDCASIAWFCLEFAPWAQSLDCKKVIFIGGNHDFFLEHIMYGPVRDDGTRKVRTAAEVLKKLLPGNNKSKFNKLVYLRDNSVEIEGKRFYGTPWIADLSRWAFYNNNEGLESMWQNIPKKLDVLMTHMPPGVCNMGTVLEVGYNYGQNFGSKLLYNIMLERDIKYTFCGHVHSGNHVTEEYKDGCFVTNVSVKDESYQVKTFYYKVFEI